MRSLHKLEALLRRALHAAGAQEMSLPALCRTESWKCTGRLDEMREELFQLRDRQDREYLLCPTHEEVITELLAETAPISHKQLPLLLYQMTSKYRDEMRPRHGMLRAREFLMCDAYGFHADEECARRTYECVATAYADLFLSLRIPYYRVSADSGAMGGTGSHEWHYAAPAGEDSLVACERCDTCRRRDDAERADDACPQCGGRVKHMQSIEVAHTFLLGSRYTLALNATHTSTPPSPLAMACYGVGVTRLLAAGVEALSSQQKLRWPHRTSPYTAVVVGPKDGSTEHKDGGGRTAETLARALASLPGLEDDVLLDDRDKLTVGRRLLDLDKMGYPLIAVVGRQGLELHSHTAPPQIFNTQDQIVDAVRQYLAMDSCNGNTEMNISKALA